MVASSWISKLLSDEVNTATANNANANSANYNTTTTTNTNSNTTTDNNRSNEPIQLYTGQYCNGCVSVLTELEKQMKIENLFVTWQQRSAQSNMPISVSTTNM